MLTILRKKISLQATLEKTFAKSASKQSFKALLLENNSQFFLGGGISGRRETPGREERYHDFA